MIMSYHGKVEMSYLFNFYKINRIIFLLTTNLIKQEKQENYETKINHYDRKRIGKV